MRIVIDTNIWISGLLWYGKSWELLNLVEKGNLELCTSYPMLLELEEVLAYEKFMPRLKVLKQTPKDLISYALLISSIFDISKHKNKTPIVADDPDDDMFLLCAIESNANYIISNDHHLLNLKSYKGIKIVSIDKFFEECLMFNFI